MVTGLGVNCVGTLAAQEGQFGDVIQPESGGLSPSDTGNRSLRAGGGARSHPSSRGGAGGVFLQALGDGTCSPASTFSTDPTWEHPQTPPEGVPLRGTQGGVTWTQGFK